jgi:hypothetical protein
MTAIQPATPRDILSFALTRRSIKVRPASPEEKATAGIAGVSDGQPYPEWPVGQQAPAAQRSWPEPLAGYAREPTEREGLEQGRLHQGIVARSLGSSSGF